MSSPFASLAGAEGGPIAVAILCGGPALAATFDRTPWWIAVLVATSLAIVVGVPIRGRTLARWSITVLVYRVMRQSRARQREQLPEFRDIQVAAGLCGIGQTDSALVAMVQLAPNLDLPTIIGEKAIYTEDTISVDTLSSLCRQYGLLIDIDIVTTGRRVRQVGNYGDLYNQLIGPRPVVGQRLAWLVLRMDLHRNLEKLRRRGQPVTAAPKALANAAHRVSARLREIGIAAHPLPTEAVREAYQLLQDGIELTTLSERWGRLHSTTAGRTIVMYQAPIGHSGTTLDDLWSQGKDHTTIVVSLRAGHTPRIMVRYIHPGTANTEHNVSADLQLLTGRQSQAFMSTLPTATGAHDVAPGEYESATGPTDLQVAIGPSGQVLGSLTGRHDHSLALPLFDPVRYHPRRRTVDIHADLPIAQQIVLRATVVGADIEVHTDRPEQWQRLVNALGDQRSLRLVSEHQAVGEQAAEDTTTPATIVVFDRISPRSTRSSTTVTITAPDQPRRATTDLAIEQVAEAAVEVSIPLRTVRVDLIEPRGETRYVDPLHSMATARTTSPPPSNPVTPEPDDLPLSSGDAR